MEESQIRKTFSRAGFALLVFLLSQFAVSIGSGFVLESLFPQIADSGRYDMLYTLPLYIICYPLLALMLKLIPGESGEIREKYRPGFFDMVKLLLVSFAVMYLINAGTLMLMTILKKLSGLALENPLDDIVNQGNFWLNLAFMCILAPVFEEYIFRKLLYDKLAVYGGAAYIIFSSVVFGLFHLNVYQLFYAMGLGMVFSAVMYFTGKVRYPIILHGLVNFIGGIVPQFVINKESTVLLASWGVITIILVIIGMIFLFDDLAHYRDKFKFTSSPFQIYNYRIMFKNKGMVAYIIISVIFTAFSLFILM